MRIGAGLTAAAVVVAGLGVAPAAAHRAAPELLGPTRPTYVRSVLTDDASHFRFARRPGGAVAITGRADEPRNADWNRREVFRRPGARPVRDQTSCATWARQSTGMVQEGLAVRIVDRGGRIRAVTLTKNTLFGVHWVFNLLTWDTARRAQAWRRVGQFDMSPAVGASLHRLEPLPWRVCLRATGRDVAFKVWFPGRIAKPSWSDATYARSARLPRGFVFAGRPGWYVGHVPEGGEVVYRGLSTRGR